MNEQNKTGFEPPVMTVLTSIFDQDINTASVNYVWSIGEIPDLNE